MAIRCKNAEMILFKTFGEMKKYFWIACTKIRKGLCRIKTLKIKKTGWNRKDYKCKNWRNF